MLRPSVKKTVELRLSAENEPGVLARVLGAVSAGGMNIIAYCAYEMGDTARIHVVAEDPEAARERLENIGLKIESVDALCVLKKNYVGSECEIARKLGQEGINILYAYATSVNEDGPYLSILITSDDDKAVETLSR